eukprot:scaffold6067_cov112-Isochrysis_galbana.AAC.20
MIPDVCSGSMPHVTPFHSGREVASAYRQASPIATSHSTSDDVWMIHVGTDSAFTGSAGHTHGGRLPTPPSHGVCTCAPPPANTATAERADRPPHTAAAVRSRGLRSSAADSASRKPRTTMQLVIARRDSAAPCSQSASARETPYSTPAPMAAGMEPNTKARRNVRPKLTPGGARTFG